MNIIAVPYATYAVQRFVLKLNTHLASTPFEGHAKAGLKRAIQRRKDEANRMKAWHKSAIEARASIPPSRQVRRRQEMGRG